MRIDHLINGRPVAGKDYFETVNPATQEVLAEVASGGEAEVHAAVAAAKGAFPAWAATHSRTADSASSTECATPKMPPAHSTAFPNAACSLRSFAPGILTSMAVNTATVSPTISGVIFTGVQPIVSLDPTQRP